MGSNTFVGFANYQRVFSDGKFWDGMLRTFGFGLVQVPVMLGLALVFALIIDAGTVWGRAVFRIGFFIPYAVPGVIAALIWGYLYGPSYGPITQVFNAIGIAPPNFLDGNLVLTGIGNIVTWEFTGYNMIILYSALQAIPSDLEEAAAIEGAKGWQIARLIKIPMIAPALLLTLVFSVIGTLQLFGRTKAAAHHGAAGRQPCLYAQHVCLRPGLREPGIQLLRRHILRVGRGGGHCLLCLHVSREPEEIAWQWSVRLPTRRACVRCASS
ncbi:sugar ABC transporter permease [Devosia sp. A8/3-2]|nr:sugar ABC transporter permease [Devosia sp. A8/3-2]